MSFIEIKKKSAFDLVLSEKSIIDILAKRGKNNVKKDKFLELVSTILTEGSKEFSEAEIIDALGECMNSNLVYQNFMF